MVDLVVQRGGVATRRAHPFRQPGAVLTQHRRPVRDREVPLRPQPREALHVRDRHAGLAQPDQELQPGHVGRLVAPLVAGGPADPLDQAGLLVVAQGVVREAGELGDLGDGEGPTLLRERLSAVHEQDRETWSALQVKGSGDHFEK